MKMAQAMTTLYTPPAFFLHPLRFAKQVADCFALDNQAYTCDDAEEAYEDCHTDLSSNSRVQLGAEFFFRACAE